MRRRGRTQVPTCCPGSVLELIAERFGAEVAQMLGAAEHRSERIRRCVSEERKLQRRRWAASASKIRQGSLAVTTCSLGGRRFFGWSRLFLSFCALRAPDRL